MNIDVTFTTSEKLRGLMERARTMPRLAVEAAAKALALSAQVIVGNAVEYRFTNQKGPFPISEHKLGFITRRLRQSITATRPQLHYETGEASVAFGSNVKYFAIHEFGFSGNVNVRAHNRKGRPVRAHSRAVNIAARAPMTTELQHPRTVSTVTTAFERALSAALNP